MLFSYEECIKKYATDYKIKQALNSSELFKISTGIYSDRKNVSDTAVISKKYPKAVFTLNSAFFFHGLTDTIPSYYYLFTDKNDSKISNSNIIQIFDNNNSLKMGSQTITYNDDEISTFNKERLLVELIRNKHRFAYDYYKEIVGSYRNLINRLDFHLVEQYAEQLPKTRLVLDTIQSEVF